MFSLFSSFTVYADAPEEKTEEKTEETPKEEEEQIEVEEVAVVEEEEEEEPEDVRSNTVSLQNSTTHPNGRYCRYTRLSGKSASNQRPALARPSTSSTAR